MVGAYAILILWATVVLFPLYWVLVTSVKLPVTVNTGPFYIPWVDFTPSLHAWQYILETQRDQTLRPYWNTIIVATTSTLIALFIGSTAAYALVRFKFAPKTGLIYLFIACIGGTVAITSFDVSWQLASASMVAVYVLLAVTLRKRFTKTMGNSDIAFWLISQRMMPPIVVVLPIYVMFQQVGLLDTYTGLVIAYVAGNLPIVVWLMRDYFQNVPIELEECAAIDGASRLRTFWTIVLPLSAPGLVATFLFVLVFAWNEYLLALFLSSSQVQTMPLVVAAQSGTRGTEWWYMSVVILLMIGPVIAMAIASERFISRGLLVGAVKG
ncbi:MAG: carbohydrate ABC transporter permease [Chloroflexi bacterium]|nr:carbohydrate ABC transporter permease [Chloroflexota bacterium]